MPYTLPAKPPAGNRAAQIFLWVHAPVARVCRCGRPGRRLALARRTGRVAGKPTVRVLDRKAGVSSACQLTPHRASRRFDTGPVRDALWSLLGRAGSRRACLESFGKGAGWAILAAAAPADLRKFEAPYGRLPDLAGVEFDRDVVFTWNGNNLRLFGVSRRRLRSRPNAKASSFCDATSPCLP